MSKPGLGRGGAAGGKWVSNRAAQATTTQVSSPTVQTPMSAPHAPGGHGFEDSAVNEHARRAHGGQAAEEPQSSSFDRQQATDALSNLCYFREDDVEAYQAGKHTILPSNLNFHSEILSKIKPIR